MTPWMKWETAVVETPTLASRLKRKEKSGSPSLSLSLSLSLWLGWIGLVVLGLVGFDWVVVGLGLDWLGWNWVGLCSIVLD